MTAWGELAGLLLLVGVYAGARFGYRLAGVRFDLTPLATFWQYIDAPLLRNDLWRSIWFLHSQPPLYNLYLGLVLRGFDSPTAAFAGASVALGALTVAAAWVLARRLGAGRLPTLVLVGLYAISPTLVLYESWLSYALPAVCLLTVAALAVERLAATAGHGWAVLLGTTLTLLCLVVSMFHPVLLVLAILPVLLMAPVARRRGTVALAVALAVVLGWYTRNWIMFGSFSSSSWFGMNLARMTHTFVPMAERHSLVLSGRLSAVSEIAPFSPLAAYRGRYVPPVLRVPSGIPVLEQQVRESGAPNYNHRDYIAVARLYRRDAVWLLRNRPAAYWRSVLDAALIFFMPATANRLLQENRDRIKPAVLAGELLQGRLMYYVDPELQRCDLARFYRQKLCNAGLLLPVLYLLTFLGSILLALRLRRRAAAVAATVAFIGLLLGYVLVTGVLLEVGENMRFRSLTEPVMLVMLAVFVTGPAQRRLS